MTEAQLLGKAVRVRRMGVAEGPSGGASTGGPIKWTRLFSCRVGWYATPKIWGGPLSISW